MHMCMYVSTYLIYGLGKLSMSTSWKNREHVIGSVHTATHRVPIYTLNQFRNVIFSSYEASLSKYINIPTYVHTCMHEIGNKFSIDAIFLESIECTCIFHEIRNYMHMRKREGCIIFTYVHTMCSFLSLMY